MHFATGYRFTCFVFHLLGAVAHIMFYPTQPSLSQVAGLLVNLDPKSPNARNSNLGAVELPGSCGMQLMLGSFDPVLS